MCLFSTFSSFPASTKDNYVGESSKLDETEWTSGARCSKDPAT